MTDVAWWLFIVSSVVIIIAPGQDFMLVMSRALAHGARAGIATAGGVAVGLLVHTVLATLGVGAIVQASATLFLAMKLLGACYLIWLGVSLLRSASAPLATVASPTRSAPRLFTDGVVSNVANPKIAIFYFAFLPQFVPAGVSEPGPVIFVLGALFALLTFLIKAPVGWFASALSGWLRAKPMRLRWVYRTSGLAMIVLALRLVTQNRPV